MCAPQRYDRDAGEEELAETMMIRVGQWKLIRHRHSTDELYDLDSDPGEMSNLAGDPAHGARIEELWGTVTQTLTRQGPGPYAWCLA